MIEAHAGHTAAGDVAHHHRTIRRCPSIRRAQLPSTHEAVFASRTMTDECRLVRMRMRALNTFRRHNNCARASNTQGPYRRQPRPYRVPPFESHLTDPLYRPPPWAAPWHDGVLSMVDDRPFLFGDDYVYAHVDDTRRGPGLSPVSRARLLLGVRGDDLATVTHRVARRQLGISEGTLQSMLPSADKSKWFKPRATRVLRVPLRKDSRRGALKKAQMTIIRHRKKAEEAIRKTGRVRGGVSYPSATLREFAGQLGIQHQHMKKAVLTDKIVLALQAARPRKGIRRGL